MASSPNSPAAVNGLASKLFVLVNYSFCAFSFSFAFAFDPGDAGSHIKCFRIPTHGTITLLQRLLPLYLLPLSRTIGDDYDLQVSAIVLYPH